MSEYSLGIDLGSSSVKTSLLDLKSGKCAASASYPESEAPIISPQKNWAEQDPEQWWTYLCKCLEALSLRCSLASVRSIGISYQMHGLVCLDSKGQSLRRSIIWCDSRAVEIGRQAFTEIGKQKCLGTILNSPGNFTASKLAWVKRNEAETYSKIAKVMLPGDYIAYRLSSEISTTPSGLSEAMLWDFSTESRADFVADYFGFDKSIFPGIVPSIGLQARTNSLTERLFGIPQGTPVSYRAGDQPNNAFSLNVLRSGEVAATAGTSGVVYGVGQNANPDPEGRVNTFLHVTPFESNAKGVLLCINSVGIMNSWARRQFCPELSYPEMNSLAAQAPVGSDSLMVLPFGNGAERMLSGKAPGAGFIGLDLVRSNRSSLLRAVQEGIACAFNYGMDIMKAMGLNLKTIKAGSANMFLSPLFCSTLSSLSGATIELYDTDGSLGAARGAALGAGLYSDASEAFASLELKSRIEPCPEWKSALEELYGSWRSYLENQVINK